MIPVHSGICPANPHHAPAIRESAGSTTDRLLGLRLAKDAASEVALAEVVLNSPLLRSGALGESRRATEGTRKGGVLDSDDANVAGTTNAAGAGHASRHLDLYGEVGSGSPGETADTDSRNVLGDLCGLEGARVGSTRTWINISGQGTSAVLVDLVEGHSDSAIVGAGGQAGGSTLSSSCGDTRLGSAFGGLLALGCGTAGSTAASGICVASKEVAKNAARRLFGSASGSRGSAASTSHEG